MSNVVIAIPCYNEEHRLDAKRLLSLLREPGLDVLFVDDGSTDRTLLLLQNARASAPDRVHILSLPRNSGKAEAVRQGMLEGLKRGAHIVGFLDADLAAPPEELVRLLEALKASQASVALGARVRMLGRSIRRNPIRHYLGRTFATAASFVLALPIYDSQCGAKLFRDCAALRRALRTPFHSRWAFDVELIHRLTSGDGQQLSAQDFIEVPLHEWHHVSGSKLSMTAMAHAAFELLRIARDRRRA